VSIQFKQRHRLCAAACTVAALLAGTPAAGIEQVTLQQSAVPVLTDAPRIGLNLGGSSTWGAEQLVANVLKNPGFEPLVDRTLVIVKEVAGTAVMDDTHWLGRPDGFWDGGRYVVRSGAAVGRSGRIAESRRRGESGPGLFQFDPFPSGLAPGDAVVVSVERAATGVPLWWTGNGKPAMSATEARPGSPGVQSARLVALPGARARLDHHLDMLGARAGKLLPMDGVWQLSFWARGKRGAERLAVSLRRHGAAAFLEKEIALTGQWRRYEFDIAAKDDGPPGPLSLSFELSGGEALLDDASLGEKQTGAGGFRGAVVSVLAALRPGYLRDWQGQLGDALQNRLAGPHARQPVRYRPGEAEQMYFYGLPEFLELCQAVGAQPWIVAPPLMDDAEWRELGAFLAQAAARHRFREILVEFGNENWNELFRPGGFVREAVHAQVADRALRLVREGAGNYPGIVAVLNAQFVNPATWVSLASLSRQANRIAVAPYFLYSLDESSPEKAAAAAFVEGDATLRAGIAGVAARGRAVAVYEVNFHTTAGSAGELLRNSVVAGAQSGAALARRLLQAALAGVREQAVYSLAGFDSYVDGPGRKLVRLWGIARDLAPGTLRPTGLAVGMLNRAMAGNVHAGKCSGAARLCQAVTAAWFVQGQQVRLAVVSAANEPLEIRTDLPCGRAYGVDLLDGSNHAASNELDNGKPPGVAVVAAAATCALGWTFTLPPHSLAVLRERP
jgi:hypothetical protein